MLKDDGKAKLTGKGKDALKDKGNVKVKDVLKDKIKLGPQQVVTPDFGTVTLSIKLYNRWNTDAKFHVGWPIANSFNLPGGGSAVYCETGMIVEKPGLGVFMVYGLIYARYRDLGDVTSWVGLPVSDEAPAANNGRVSKFQNADIYWRGDTGAHEVHGAIRDRWLSLGGAAGFLGYPLTDETVLMNGHTQVGRFNRFQGGVIYWSAATGAWEVHGKIRDYWENQCRGALGDMGLPVSNEVTTGSGKYRYSNFQKGVLVWKAADNSIAVFNKLDVYLDRFDSKGDDGFLRGGQDIYVKTNVTASSGEKWVKRMPSSGDYSADEQINKVLFTIPVVHGDTTIHARFEGWDSDWPDGDDHLGTVDRTFNIENLWGLDENAVHWAGDFMVAFKVRQIVTFDATKFRENLYWKFHNFSTEKLSWSQYAATFTDVNNDESVIWHPFDHIFYQVAYKGVAAGGNCFGMCWESIFAQVGRSVYNEPISRYAPTDGSKPKSPANSEIINEINIKHGYQVSGPMIDWFLPKFMLGQTHDPVRAFRESRSQFASGDFPVLALTEASLEIGGHVIRPYAWDDSSKPWKIFCADPNQPLTSGADDRKVFVEIDPDRNTFKFKHADNDIWTGGEWSGGRLYSIPFSTVCHQPRTPFWEVMALLLGGALVLLGGDAATEQIRDSEGRTMYNAGTGKIPTLHEHLQQGDKRIPNMARLHNLNDLGAHFKQVLGHLDVKLIKELVAKNTMPEMYYMTRPRPPISKTALNVKDFVKLGHALAVAQVPEGKAGAAAKKVRTNDELFNESRQLAILADLAKIGNELPADALEHIVRATGSYSWAVRSTLSSAVANVPGGAKPKDSFIVESVGRANQAVTFKPEVEKSIALALAGNAMSTAEARSFAVSNLGLRQGQKVRVHLDPNTGALVLENTGDATKMDVRISAGTKNPGVATRTQIPLEKGSINRIEPLSWTPGGLTSTKLKFEQLEKLGGAAKTTKEI